MTLKLTSTVATLLFVGTVMSAAPAFAGADDAGTKAFWSTGSNTAAPTSARTSSSNDYKAVYDASKDKPVEASGVQRDPESFAHATGSMGSP